LSESGGPASALTELLDLTTTKDKSMNTNDSAVKWDAGSPCVKPRPEGMIYPEKPQPRYHGRVPDGSGVEWAAYDAAQMEAYARAAYADGYQKACDDFADEV